ncbi:hypothetical protein SISSUDRAFT_995382, partial [Sistotremastrum suecicum HHB10207 ss-3]
MSAYQFKRDVISRHNHEHDPEGVRDRRARVFVRHLYDAAAVNECWAFDQHDKWRRFGLYLHVGLEAYSGRVMWLKIWWTNRNPRLVCSYL